MTGADQQVGPDDVMRRIGVGIGLRERGETAVARRVLAELWDEIGGESGDAFHRCAIAHSMADVQDDVEQELTWDLRALSAADQISDERAAQGGVGSVAGFYPSLHLNLAECYRKLGQIGQARDHVTKGVAACSALGDDGYALMVRGGLERVARQLR
jgi:hypothetical protein